MTDIDTPTHELPKEHPQPSVNTTVPVEKAQRRPEQEGNAADPASPQLPHERDQSVGLTVFNVSACPRTPAASCNHPDADMCCGGGFDGPCDCECHSTTSTVPASEVTK